MKFKYHDKSHSYYLDGKRCKGISGLGKNLEDGTSLEKWKLRQVMLGMTLSPDLVESVGAHFDDYKKMEEHIEEALAIAKANAAAQRGTTKHKITDRLDKGETVIDTPLSREVVRLWREALEGEGLEVLPEYVERFVVYPNRFLAGRLDRIMRRKADGKLVIVDLKSGERAIEYPHSVAVQLAFYAHAPLLVGDLGFDGVTERFEEMPELDYEVGYVIHMPADGTAKAVPIDIAAGWDIAEAVMGRIFEWRARKDLVLPPTIKADDGWGNDLPGNITKEPLADASAINAVRTRREGLTSELKLAVDAWAAQSAEAGRPLGLKQNPYVRNVAIANAIMACAEATSADEQVARAVLAVVMGYEPQTTVTTGALFGALTTDEAQRVERFAAALGDDHSGVLLTFDDATGAPVVLGNVA